MTVLRRFSVGLTPAITALLVCGNALAASTENGNELARRLMYGQKNIERDSDTEKNAVGNLYFFRYMKVVEKKAITNTTPTTYFFQVQEPSVGMYVEFVVTKQESLKIAEATQIGEALAFVGRIKTISKLFNKIEISSVIVRYKDRLAPKKGKELLSDVDPNARYGTDTTNGDERVIKK